MVRNLFLVRHGESIGNSHEDDYRALPDSKLYLTQKGVSQIHDTGKFLKDFIDNNEIDTKYSKMFVSPYTRTRQTAEVLNDHLRIKDVTVDDLLSEMQFGLYYNLEYYSQDFPSLEEHYKLDKRINGDFYSRCPGGESSFDCYIRQRMFADVLDKSFHDNKYNTIVIVGHGIALTLLRKALFNYDADWFSFSLLPDNGSIQHITYNTLSREMIDNGYIHLGAVGVKN